MGTDLIDKALYHNVFFSPGKDVTSVGLDGALASARLHAEEHHIGCGKAWIGRMLTPTEDEYVRAHFNPMSLDGVVLGLAYEPDESNGCILMWQQSDGTQPPFQTKHD